MVADSSAFVAIVLGEARAVEFMEKMSSATSLRMSTVSFVESSMVLLARGGQVKVDLLDAVIARYGVEIVAVDMEQAFLARMAFDRYGKGRSAAGLNFGDCFSYALAVAYGEALLFHGNDFGQTDVLVA